MDVSELKEFILAEYGIDINLRPFGTNLSRDNIYIAHSREGDYIVKIESPGIIDQIDNFIMLSNELLKSSTLSSSRYILTKTGVGYAPFKEKFITIQIKENLQNLHLESPEDIVKLGMALGEFHKVLLAAKIKKLKISDFYHDFMGNEIMLAQTPQRLEEINNFYKKYTPDYANLTQGIVHNDLNINNIFLVKNKYFFIDFEHMKYSPLISDIAVLVLEIWDYNKGIEDYIGKLNSLIEGYQKKMALTDYDKSNIVIFSIRYLYSDENWFNYWALRGNTELEALIPETINKQRILLNMIAK